MSGDHLDPEFTDQHDPKFAATVDMIRRTGATAIQIRYSDDEQPVVWILTVEHHFLNGLPVPEGTPGAQRRWDAAAGMTPVTAAIRLMERLMDGGTCVHCKRPSGVTVDFTGDMPLDELVCWTRWDPELSTYRRSCEGAT